MQELPDKEFDAFIVRALRAEASPSPSQQQRAWEALRLKAAQQTMLSAPTPTLFARARQFVQSWGKVRLTSLYRLVLDDSVYRRAQHQYPLMMRHQRPHSTFAAAEFMLLA